MALWVNRFFYVCSSNRSSSGRLGFPTILIKYWFLLHSWLNSQTWEAGTTSIRINRFCNHLLIQHVLLYSCYHHFNHVNKKKIIIIKCTRCPKTLDFKCVYKVNTNVYGTLEHILCHNISIHSRYTHIVVHTRFPVWCTNISVYLLCIDILWHRICSSVP